MATTDTMDAKADIAAVIAWWRDAGIDHVFADEPQPLVEREKPEPLAEARVNALPAPPIAEAPAFAGELPADLPAFREWWLTEPRLDNGRLSGRVAPQGQTEASAMVVVEQPEAEDSERLLSGPQGNLLRSMLSAMGLALDGVYLASALPRNMPLPDWQELVRAGLGKVLVHHVSIVRPQRLILFGGNILPLLGNHLPNSAQSSPRFNHEGFSVPVFAARDLPALLGSPRFKARLWNDWLAWNRDQRGE